MNQEQTPNFIEIPAYMFDVWDSLAKEENINNLKKIKGNKMNLIDADAKLTAQKLIEMSEKHNYNTMEILHIFVVVNNMLKAFDPKISIGSLEYLLETTKEQIFSFHKSRPGSEMNFKEKNKEQDVILSR